MLVLGARASSFSLSQHAMIIGVDRVSGDWLAPLQAPSRDAAAIAASLIAEKGCAIPSEQVQLRVNHNAMRGPILEAIRDVVSRLGPESNFFLYFAGHGIDDGEDFYLVTSDAERTRLRETAISGSDLQTALVGCPANGICLIVDCCEGGAAADYAPSVFRRLPEGGYRILLASSRPGQLSWEKLDGSGTLFSSALQNILSGDIRVGDGSGAIYFADLVKGLDATIRENLAIRAGDGPASQEMTWASASTRDPLLFVHRGLSLASIELRTARFSPEFVRRRIRQTALAIGAVLLFSTVTIYGMLDATQYAAIDGESLVVRKGDPRFNLPGYPQFVWGLDYGLERLTAAATSSLPIVGHLGELLGPRLESMIRPDYRAAALADSAQASESRRLALQLIDDPATPQEQKLFALLVFPTVSLASDAPRLRRLLRHERREVRVAAFTALLQHAQQPKDVLEADEATAVDESDHDQIIKRLWGACTPVLNAYLEKEFSSPSNVPRNADIIDAALRLGCDLSVDALITGTLRPGFVGDADLANFAVVRGLSKPFGVQLGESLANSTVEPWVVATMLGTLARLPDGPCVRGLVGSPKLTYPLATLLLRAALVRHCDGMSWSVSWDGQHEQFIVHLAGGSVDLPDMNFSPTQTSGQLGIRFLLDVRALKDPMVLKEAIAQLLRPTRSDDFVRTGLVRVATSLGLSVRLPEDILDSNNLDVRRAVTEYERSQDDTAFAQRIVSRLGARDEFYVELAGRTELDAALINTIEPLLTSGPGERRQAGCVMAMQAHADRVLELMVSPDSIVRTAATGCAPFHRDAEKLAARLPDNVAGFSLGGRPNFLRQVTRRKDVERMLEQTPVDLRAWRLSIMNIEPGGLWSAGMRSWIREKRYRLSVAKQ
jgi:hypothetical protein